MSSNNPRSMPHLPKRPSALDGFDNHYGGFFVSELAVFEAPEPDVGVLLLSVIARAALERGELVIWFGPRTAPAGAHVRATGNWRECTRVVEDFIDHAPWVFLAELPTGRVRRLASALKVVAERGSTVLATVDGRRTLRPDEAFRELLDHGDFAIRLGALDAGGAVEAHVVKARKLATTSVLSLLLRRPAPPPTVAAAARADSTAG